MQLATPGFTGTISSSGLIAALGRNLDVFPKGDIPRKVFAHSLDGAGDQVGVTKSPVWVSLAVDSHCPVLAGALPRAGVSGGAFGEKTGSDGRRWKIPVPFNRNQVSLVGFGNNGSIDVSFHSSHAKHPGWEHPGRDTMVGVKVTASTTLPVDIDTAWDMLHAPAVFRAVSAPFTIFREKPGHPLPERFSPDTDYTVSVFAGGVVPLGTQIIHLEDSVTSWRQRHTVDVGRGVTGLLSFLQNWQHRMSLEALPNGHTRFNDQLTVDATWLTPFMWPAFSIFWAWRATSLKRLAKRRRRPLQDTWDARYSGRSRLWSGVVNPWVEAVAAKQEAGRALDLGCGEGADALWLAEQGWQVDAVDVSGVAVFRGADEVERRQGETSIEGNVNWKVSDLETAEFEPESFDFVSLQFLHLPPGPREELWHKAVGAVCRGGTLVIVGHSVTDQGLGIPRPPSAFLFSPEDVGNFRPPNWAMWNVFEEGRASEGDTGTVTVTDVVLIAQR